MATKRKISVRKILQVFVTLVVTVCCIIAMVSASRIEDNKKIKSIAVHIKNDKRYHFIEQQEILDLAIGKRQIDLEHTPVSRLDIRAMEQVIMADPWVANAQVYIDNENVLQIYVTQRIPIARVFDRNNRTYYLDTTMSIMPVSANYIYYTTMVTNMPELKNDKAGWAIRKDVIAMVRHMQADSFWNAQISQIIVDSAGMYELTPVLGDQRIIFGDISDMNDKLNNLFVFYKKVLNRIGWDKYETLDLRFKDQVVASPSLPYKGPVDKAVVNMNWINSIVETEAKKDAQNETHDSVKAKERAVQAAIDKKKAAAADKKKVSIKRKAMIVNAHGKHAMVLARKPAMQARKGKAAKPTVHSKAKNTTGKNKKQTAGSKDQQKKKNQ